MLEVAIVKVTLLPEFADLLGFLFTLQVNEINPKRSAVL